MIPSLSKRIAPVNCSRHSSTSRSTSWISLISPSSMLPLFRWTGDYRMWLTMQLLPQRLPHLSPQHVHEILRRRLADRGHAAEALEQEAFALLADARQVIELAVERPFRAPAAVRRDGEAMSLIADHLQELQRGIVALEADRLLAIGNVNLLLPLRKPRDRDLLDPELRQRRERRIQLSAAAVDQDHVRQRLLFFEQAAVAAIHGLRHRAEVV